VVAPPVQPTCQSCFVFLQPWIQSKSVSIKSVSGSRYEQVGWKHSSHGKDSTSPPPCTDPTSPSDETLTVDGDALESGRVDGDRATGIWHIALAVCRDAHEDVLQQRRAGRRPPPPGPGKPTLTPPTSGEVVGKEKIISL
jgi:hypothetical protein